MLKIIFWILTISFIIRLVARLALPHVIRSAEERMRERMNNFQANQQPPRKEGEVSIENKSKNSTKSKDDDYVDYVEIKD